jgi:hypothetical protein
MGGVRLPHLNERPDTSEADGNNQFKNTGMQGREVCANSAGLDPAGAGSYFAAWLRDETGEFARGNGPVVVSNSDWGRSTGFLEREHPIPLTDTPHRGRTKGNGILS